MAHKTNSYLQFLRSMNSVTSRDLQQNANYIIQRFRPTQQVSSHYAPVVFMLDFRSKKYVYMGEACFDLLGYTPNYFYETGLEVYLRNLHPADFQTINTKVFVDNIHFLETLPNERYNEYIFSYNYRVKNAVDEYVTVLQRFSYISSDLPAKPLGVVGVAFDITHFKCDCSIVHTIEEVVGIDEGKINKLVFKKVHPVYETESLQLISKKELEVLRYMAQGLSSKQISAQMNISINTVNNHRKNMLAKTGCKTSSELINYALRHGSL